MLGRWIALLLVVAGCKQMLGFDDPQLVDGDGGTGDSQHVDAAPDVPAACANGRKDNLEADIGETRNLADQEPERLAEMLARLKEIRASGHTGR